MRIEVPAPRNCSPLPPPPPPPLVFIRFLTQRHPGSAPAVECWCSPPLPLPPPTPLGGQGCSPDWPKGHRALPGDTGTRCWWRDRTLWDQAWGPWWGGTPHPSSSCSPPSPFPGSGGGPGCQLPGGGGGCALISFLLYCCTWVNVRVCYLHKELPSPQRLPPPSWGTGDLPLPCTSALLPPPAPQHGPALHCTAPARVCDPPTSSTGARAWGRSLMGWGAAASGHRMYSAAGRGAGASSTCRYTGAGPGGALPPPAP